MESLQIESRRITYAPLRVGLTPAEAFTLAMWLHSQATINARLPDGIAELYRKTAVALSEAARLELARVP